MNSNRLLRAALLLLCCSIFVTTLSAKDKKDTHEKEGLFLNENLPVALTPSGKDQLVPIKYSITANLANKNYSIMIEKDDMTTHVLFNQYRFDQLRNAVKTCIRWIDQIKKENLTVELKEIAQIQAITSYFLKTGLHGADSNNKVYLSLTTTDGISRFLMVPMAGYSSTGEYLFIVPAVLFEYDELKKLDELLSDNNLERLTQEAKNKKDDSDKLQ